MFGRKIIWSLILVCAAALNCTRDFSIISLPKQTGDLRPLEKRVLNASSRFGVDLFKEIAKNQTGKNIFISPFSVSAALGMTLNGAAGQTESDMRNTLGFSGMDQAEINQSYRNLLNWLPQADPKVVMDIAQSIWYREGFTVEPSFIQTNRVYFDALVRDLNFTLPSAKDTINSWIERNTGGKIQNMVPEVKRTDVMFLVNAVFFKGIWKIQFDPKETRNELFARENGLQVNCTMMRQRDSLLYYSTKDFQAVDLAYGDDAFGMLILLPRADLTVDAFIQNLSNEKWSDWVGQLAKTEVFLILPKFKIECDTPMDDALKNMGMAGAFTDQADFTRINREGGLFIDRVLHKAFVDVNEEGTEAAAATVVVIWETSIGGPEQVYMCVNRPSVFAIRERQTGVILFMGKMAEPG